jgi:hypothetical protein
MSLSFVRFLFACVNGIQHSSRQNARLAKERTILLPGFFPKNHFSKRSLRKNEEGDSEDHPGSVLAANLRRGAGPGQRRQ